MNPCPFDDEKSCSNDVCVGKDCPLNPTTVTIPALKLVGFQKR